MTSLAQQFNQVNTKDVYDDGLLRIEHKKFHIELQNNPVRMGRSEFLIVSLMAQNAERYVSPEAMWQHVWEGRKPFNFESLKVIICRLRRRIEPFGMRIETMPNIGYKLMRAKQN
jgi:DNA-binding response OmpR family regulator